MTNVSYSSNQMNIYPNLSLGVFLKSPALEVTPFWGSRFQRPGRLAAWSLLDGWMLRFVWPRLVSWPQDICKSSKERGTTARNHQNVLCGDVPLFLSSLPLREGAVFQWAAEPWESCAPSPCSDKFPGHAEPCLGRLNGRCRVLHLCHCSRFFSGKLEVPLIPSLMIDDNCKT